MCALIYSGAAKNNHPNRGWHCRAFGAFPVLGIVRRPQLTKARPSAAALLAALAFVPALSGPARAALPADPLRLTGLYGGSHVCEDGEHGALLEITRVIADDTPEYPWRLEGRYAFYPVMSGRAGVYGESAGSFRLLGEIRADGHVTLDNLGWLVAPQTGEGAGDFEGRFAVRSDGLMQFEGQIDTGVPGECGAVLLTRALPVAEGGEP
jgi:hypothetical protein